MENIQANDDDDDPERSERVAAQAVLIELNKSTVVPKSPGGF